MSLTTPGRTRSSEFLITANYPEVSAIETLLEATPRPVLITGCSTELGELGRTMYEFGGRIGEPYIEEKESSELIQIIRPEENVAEQSSNSFDVELRLHTENPHEALEPDFLLIGCTDNPEQAITLLVNPLEVFLSLNRSIQQRLTEPRFSTLEAGKFAVAAGRERKPIAIDVPIATESFGGQYDFRVDFESTRADGNWQDALDEFEEACRIKAQEILINPGDVLILPNHRAIHGRKKFQTNPSSDERRRLLRMFVRG